MGAEFREDSLGCERNDVSSWSLSGGNGLEVSIRDGSFVGMPQREQHPVKGSSWHWAQHGEVLILGSPVSPLHPEILGLCLPDTQLPSCVSLLPAFFPLIIKKLYVNLENFGRIQSIKMQESSYQIPALRNNHLVIISSVCF